MIFQIIFVMVNIFSSSDTVPLNSIINCCTTLTILNILFSTVKLFTIGAPPHFGTDRIEVTISNRSSIILCLSVVAETCVKFVAMFWVPRVYSFQFSYLWKRSSATGWFPRISLSAAKHLPIRFLETAHMSQY
jgi:hypothetical protein